MIICFSNRIMNHLLLRLSCSSVLGIECSYEVKNQVFSRQYSAGTHIHNIAFDTFFFSVPIALGELSNHVYALIEECSFYNCYNGNGAGCISYVTISGQLNISKVCANRCCVGTGSGQFLYCSVKFHMTIFINISTIHQCAPPNTGSNDKYAALYVRDGMGYFSNINVSECHSYSMAIGQFVGNPNNSFHYAHLIQNTPVTTPAISSPQHFGNLNIYQCDIKQWTRW